MYNYLDYNFVLIQLYILNDILLYIYNILLHYDHNNDKEKYLIYYLTPSYYIYLYLFYF